MATLSQHASAQLTTHLAPCLTQSLTILQMPILELSVWLEKQLEENPVVELVSEHFSLSSFRVIESKREVEQRDFYKEKNLAEHLESQARLFFREEKDLEKALLLLAELDEKGYFPPDTPDSPILSTLQLFDPPGICARSLQESLLLQLKAKKQSSPLALLLVEQHFDDILHHRLTKLRKQLGCSSEEIYDALHQEIAPLSIHPASRFHLSVTLLPTPDLYLREEEGVWTIDVNNSYLPRIRLNTRLLGKVKEAATALYLQQCRKDAVRLLQAVRKRNATLARIGKLLLRTQRAFLEGEPSRPQYLTIREVAAELKLHPATIARAVASKFVSCGSCGIFPLKFFFRNAVSAESRDLGETISNIVSRENPKQPFSDEQIADQLRTLGFSCARRTVAKYRSLRHIPPALRRKNRSK